MLTRSRLYQGAAQFGRMCGTLAPRGPGLVVLCYHSISEADDPISIPPRLFSEQISWLCDTYDVVALQDRASTQGNDVIALTFDDAYEDFASAALEILDRYRLPATVYAITALAEDPTREFGFSTGKQKRPLSMAALGEIASLPRIEVGSHTHTHAFLPRLSDQQLRTELSVSRDIIRAIGGADRPDFCYPWGVFNSRTDIMVRQYFRSAVTGRGGKNSNMTDRYRLKRIPVRRESLSLFRHRVQGNLFLEDYARGIVDWFRLRMRIDYSSKS
jgi:peptidoglycan/xylan/chitin deacetylase (PgdA/CDA1 family)